MRQQDSKLDSVYFLKSEAAIDLSSADETARMRAYDELPHSLSSTDINYIAQHVHRTHYFASERKVRVYQRRAIHSIGEMALISSELEPQTGALLIDLATATSAAGYLERQGGLLSRFYAHRLRSNIETEITDFTAKFDNFSEPKRP